MSTKITIETDDKTETIIAEKFIGFFLQEGGKMQIAENIDNLNNQEAMVLGYSVVAHPTLWTLATNWRAFMDSSNSYMFYQSMAQQAKAASQSKVIAQSPELQMPDTKIQIVK